jgi:hypothetical protein
MSYALGIKMRAYDVVPRIENVRKSHPKVIRLGENHLRGRMIGNLHQKSA